MKIKVLHLSFLLVSLLVFGSSFLNSGGSHGAKTGSPNDGNNCTQCHSGTAQSASSSWISTNIPINGYIGGETYSITLTGVDENVVRFGFEFTAEDSNNAKVGSYSLTNTTETKLVNSDKAVTHTGNGFTPDNDSSKTWTFNWTAPGSGTGNIEFYSALLAADGNMSTSGDITYLTSLEISEDITSNVITSNLNDYVKVFPTLVEESISIEITKNIELNKLTIYSISGKRIFQKLISTNNTMCKINLNHLTKGIYIININTTKGIISKKIIKK
jgi:hypothetical protein